MGAVLGWHLVTAFPGMVDRFVCVATPHPEVMVAAVNRSYASRKRYRWG